jgi:hypothetical protein
MHNLTAHHLRFNLEVKSTIELDQHKGSALRGLLFNALRGPERNPALGFCTQRHLRSCAECALVAVCPVASLVATLNPEAERGRDVPRPYTITPPLTEQWRYEPGEWFSFGLTLFGNALNLFPYVVMALRQAGPGGLGQKRPRPEAGGRSYRGRFDLYSAQAINLLTGETQTVIEPGNSLVQRPSLPVTSAQVVEASRQWLGRPAAALANGHGRGGAELAGAKPEPVELSLHFQTPLRIIEHNRLLKAPHFSPIFHRLLERLLALSREFSPVNEPPAVAPGAEGINEGRADADPEPASQAALLALADTVELVTDQTRWQEVWSYSARQGKQTPIGGLVGLATYRAPRRIWQALLPYLLWGAIIHVGKNAVKGDGIIAVSLNK